MFKVLLELRRVRVNFPDPSHNWQRLWGNPSSSLDYKVSFTDEASMKLVGRGADIADDEDRGRLIFEEDCDDLPFVHGVFRLGRGNTEASVFPPSSAFGFTYWLVVWIGRRDIQPASSIFAFTPAIFFFRCELMWLQRRGRRVRWRRRPESPASVRRQSLYLSDRELKHYAEVSTRYRPSRFTRLPELAALLVLRDEAGMQGPFFAMPTDMIDEVVVGVKRVQFRLDGQRVILKGPSTQQEFAQDELVSPFNDAGTFLKYYGRPRGKACRTIFRHLKQVKGVVYVSVGGDSAPYLASHRSEDFNPPLSPMVRMMLAAGFVAFEKVSGNYRPDMFRGGDQVAPEQSFSFSVSTSKLHSEREGISSPQKPHRSSS
ncbi:MAG: hypothetical protein M1816_007158 [Peltula sp. TS41687]|nr:MAG: hypothetical protein M1816_007158 [Peltula sp. TS41687]